MRLEKTAGGRPSICLLRPPPLLPPEAMWGQGCSARCLRRLIRRRAANVAVEARAGRRDVWRRRSLDLQGGQSGGSEEELR